MEKEIKKFNVLILCSIISIAITITCVFTQHQYFEIIFGVISLLILFIALPLSLNILAKEPKEEIIEKKLFKKHKIIVDILVKERNKYIKELKDDDFRNIYIPFKFNDNWILSYDEKIKKLAENRITGLPDSFLQGAALIKSIVKDNCITIDYDKINESEDNFIYDSIIFSINEEIAFRAAFTLISNPITYYKNPEGEWIEKPDNKPVEKIIVPKGIINNSCLYDRISNSMRRGENISTMQLSNILHLLYLYNRDCNVESTIFKETEAAIEKESNTSEKES